MTTPRRPDMRGKLSKAYSLHMAPWWEALGKHRGELADAEKRLRAAETQLDREVASFLRSQIQGAVIASLGPTVSTIWAIWGISKAIFALVQQVPEGGASAAVKATSVTAKTLKMLQGDLGQIAGTADRLMGHFSTLVKAGRAVAAVKQVKDYHANTLALLREVERVIHAGGVGTRFDGTA